MLVVPTIFLFPSRPSSAKFLSEDERRIAVERLRNNNTVCLLWNVGTELSRQGTQNQVFKWSHVLEAIIDIKSILFMLQAFCIGIVSGGLAVFGRE